MSLGCKATRPALALSRKCGEKKSGTCQLLPGRKELWESTGEGWGVPGAVGWGSRQEMPMRDQRSCGGRSGDEALTLSSAPPCTHVCHRAQPHSASTQALWFV